MWKKSWWIIELFIIIGVFATILQIILFIGSTNPKNLIFGQVINIIVYFAFLRFAIFKIKEESKTDNHTLQYFLKNKFKLKDILSAILLFVLGQLTYFFIMKIGFVHVFGIHGLPQICHLTTIQSWIMISLIILFIPIVAFSEELYFRCYLFEIQFASFKNYTWIINGFSWSIYHIFTPTNFLALLPMCLMYSYVYQKRRNVWITIIAHLIGNIIAFNPLLKSLIP